ncbi:phospholipase D-like domain-containing protein [Croceibacterium sp. TMG7-5b_MA50]|uniref:phospholipase D-like domain-containing protein n=1 Tax=Croceibacterium sp. TMG7-5b_MA50 TaxID=3121290 RepID=UPI003221ED28
MADPFDDAPVEPGVWRFARASRVRVVIDAADYFDLMQRAMLKARRRVLLIGWDFDTRIHLLRGRRWYQKGIKRQYPSRLGSFFVWLVRHNPNLELKILKWGFGMLKLGFRGTMLFDLARWFPHRRIDFKFDNAHPLGCSHHQKIVVLDDTVAVCGGIDMTDRRWDTPEHKERDKRRRRPWGALHGPWHDITMIMEGPIAGTLQELGRDRWRRAGGGELERVEGSTGSAWPDPLEAHFTDVEIGIARTRAAYDGDEGVSEIEELILRHIARAKRFIYAENQYFASRRIAEAICARVAEPDPPEIVLVMPATADGWVEAKAMDPARDLLFRAVKAADHKDRFHLYVPYAGDTSIYVHAKLTIVDDEIIRIGSANWNNRSMGLDSECDVFIDCARPGNGDCGATIRDLRLDLLGEHVDLSRDEIGALVEQHGSMSAAITSLGAGRTHTLRPYQVQELSDLELELAERQMLDPEEPAEMFVLTPRRRGLFRRGSLLARSMKRLRKRNRA